MQDIQPVGRTHPQTGTTGGLHHSVRAWGSVDPRRVTALAVVLSVHATLLMLVMRPARPARPNHAVSRIDAVDVLDVRLIQVDPSPSPIESGRESRISAPHRNKPHRQQATTKRVTQNARNPRTSAPKALSLKLTGNTGATKHWTIGRSLSAPKHIAPKLPGHDHVHGAPKLHLIDPRFQGIAGAVRSIQHLMGIPNAHCVDVDTWRSMSPVELADRNMIESDVDRTAQRYNCIPPKRGDLSHDPFAH